jgi:hypothetical protein
MRGRILLVLIFAAAAMTACTRKTSLYIDPGRADSPAEHAGHGRLP